MKYRKFLSWILTACLVLTALPLSAVRASAVEIIVDVTEDPDPTIVVEIPDDPDPTIIVELPEDPYVTPVIIVNTNLYGAGTKESPFVVCTPRGLQMIAEMYEQGNSFDGYYICLGDDIDLSPICSIEDSKYWTPIGSQDSPFAGTFDGMGHAISNLYTAGADGCCSLFGVVSGTVRNLTVDGKLAGSGKKGGIAGENLGLIENCTFKGQLLVGSGAVDIGGIAGSNSGTIRNCTYEGTMMVGTASRIGGIVGTTKGGSVTGCVNKGSVGSDEYAGGIAGFYEGGSISDCRNEGSVAGNNNVGGIVGGLSEGLKLSGFVNTGSVTARKSNVGGIAGSAGYGSNITSCRNDGTVKGSVNVGGIVGHTKSNNIVDCVNTGSIGWNGINDGTKGGIAGYAGPQTQIKYCTNTGDVIAESKMEDRFGGIVGHADNASAISYCYNAGNVACRNEGGGIVGYAFFSPISNCFNIGKVYCNSDDGGYNFGGIAGSYEYAVAKALKDCYNAGNITGRENVGGIAGRFEDGTFEKNVSIGLVQGESDTGALIGFRWDDNKDWTQVKLNRNYFYDPSSEIDGIGNLRDDPVEETEVKAISLMQYQRNSLGNVYVDWDFNDTWYMTGDGPRLRNMFWDEKQGVVTISSVDELRRFRDNCNAGLTYQGITVQLMADLDLSGCGNWIPIGYDYFKEEAVFSGTFDGRGHTVSGLETDTGKPFTGFFGAADGMIKNLTVKGRVKGSSYVGGIAGHLDSGTIENCCFEGSVEALFNVGGIVGNVYAGTLRRCITRGSVKATAYGGEDEFSAAGGIAGYLSEISTVEECVAETDVTGNKATGGIAGCCELSVIQNCLHVGKVSSSDTGTGGVAGVASVMSGSSSETYIRNCYHFGGMVESKGLLMVGGVVGEVLNAMNDGGYSVCNCYYQAGTVRDYNDLEAGTQTDRGIGRNSLMFSQDCNPAGVAEPLTDTQFRNSGSFADWDFDTVWWMESERPVLQSAGIVPIRNIRYLDAGGTEKTAENCTGLTSGVNKLQSGWYFVEGSVFTNARIEISGDVNLILMEDACLYAFKGIHLKSGNSLTVWGETQTSGKIQITDVDDSCAGIGGNEGQDGGDLTVNGGEIVSHGGEYGAGIGGGDEGAGGNVTVNGGIVAAFGNEGSAGIGGGDYGNGGKLTVTGGSVTAVGSARVLGSRATGQASPGIGAGRPKTNGEEPRDAGYVTISGGTVIALAGTPQMGAAGAQAIGVNLADADQNGNGSANRLVLNGCLRAMGGESDLSAVTVSSGERIAACRGQYVRIEVCSVHVPRKDDSSVCVYCGATGISIDAERILEDLAERISDTPSKEEVEQVVETIRQNVGPDTLSEAMEKDESGPDGDGIVSDVAKIEDVYTDVDSVKSGIDVRTDALAKDLKDVLGDGKDTVSGVGVSLNADEGQSVDLVIDQPGPSVTKVTSDIVHKAVQFSADVKDRDTGDSVAGEDGLKVPVKIEMAVPDYFREDRIRVTDSSGGTVDVTLSKGDDGKTYAGFVITDATDITMEQQNIEAKQTEDGVSLTAIISDSDLAGAEQLAYTFYDEDGRMVAAGIYKASERSEKIRLLCDGEQVKDVKILRIGNDYTPKAEGIAVEVE